MTQVKTCFDCKMFDVANWVARLNEADGPGGTPSHEALSVSPQGALEISSVVGQPPSLDRNHFSIPRVVAESHKRNERCRPSSQRPQYPTLYRRLKRRLGRSLRASLYKGSVVRLGKKATHKCSRTEGSFSGPSKFQRPVPKPNSVGCTIFPKVQTLTGCCPVFTGIVPKVPGIFQNGTFLLCLMNSPKHPLSL